LVEKERALRGALRLKTLLESMGAIVYISRTTDCNSSLASKSSEANRLGVDFVIDYHFNAFNASSNGTEVLYVSSAGQRFATICCRNICAALGTYNRGAKYQDDHMVTQTRAVAVILEPVFLSNQADADRIRTDAGLDKLNKAIAKSLLEYYGR